jgi:hypothetical protein
LTIRYEPADAMPTAADFAELISLHRIDKAGIFENRAQIE